MFPYKVPVLVIAGSADRLLPSSDEAERLKKLIPGCRSMVLEGHGHAPLFDGRVDISEIIAGDPALEGVVFPEGGGVADEESAVSVLGEIDDRGTGALHRSTAVGYADAFITPSRSWR